jgi:hypothetical protein
MFVKFWRTDCLVRCHLLVATVSWTKDYYINNQFKINLSRRLNLRAPEQN